MAGPRYESCEALPSEDAQRDEQVVASISSSTTTLTNMNPGRTHEMMMSAHKNFVLVLVAVVVVKS